jgi:hypothetical protein
MGMGMGMGMGTGMGTGMGMGMGSIHKPWARTLVAVPQDAPEQPPVQRQLAPLDLPMVPVVVTGLIVWLIVGLVLLAFRSTLIAHGQEEWLRICLAGFLVGLPGLALMIVHDRNRRRRRSARHD